jgi:nucleotide-binding universal stress UspA family protein
MCKHILIATDGSELAAKGVEHGLALAGPLETKVTVVTVTPPLAAQVIRAAIDGGVHDPVIRYDRQVAETMKERLKAIGQQTCDHGVAAGAVDLVHEVDNYPAEAIVRIARMKNCDLIVMSSHGRRGASLTPSPTIITGRCQPSSCTGLSFCSGAGPACTPSRPRPRVTA